MKKERRHELKTNDLSIYLQQVTDYLRENGGKVILFGVLLVCLIGAVLYRGYAHTLGEEQAWAAYYEAASVIPDPEKPDWIDGAIQQWEGVVDTFDEPAVKAQSTWMLAALCLRQVIETDDVETKTELLDKAEQNCQLILTDFGSNTTLRAAALNGLAAVEQNRFVLNGDLSHKDKCRGYLEQIRNDKVFLGSPFQAEVLIRLNTFDQLWEPLVLVDPPTPPPEEVDTSEELGPEAPPEVIDQAVGAETEPEEEASSEDTPPDSDEPGPE